MNRISRAASGMAIGLAFLASLTFAEVIEFRDKDEWIAAVGDYTTIDFTGFAEGTYITDQYADLGILFTDGDDWIHRSQSYHDGAGLTSGNYPELIETAFWEAQAWLAVDYPGDVQFDLYSGSELIYTASFYAGGAGNFGGVLSTVPFDRVVISDPVDGFVYIDDLHFGVPGPSTIAAMGMLCFLSRRNRKRRVSNR